MMERMDRVSDVSTSTKKEYQVKICALSIPDELGRTYLKNLQQAQMGEYDDYSSLGVTITTYKNPKLPEIIKFVIVRANIKEFKERNRPWLLENSQGLVILFRKANPDSIETARNLYLQFQGMNPKENSTTVFIDVVSQTEDIRFPEPAGNEPGVFYYEILNYEDMTKAFDLIATDYLTTL